MIRVKSWVLPDSETHMNQFLEKDGTYQQKHRDLALSFVKEKHIVLDIGAHAGLWSRDFAKQFDVVYAFEPSKEFRECYDINVCQFPNIKAKVYMNDCALGNYNGKVGLTIDGSNTGHSHLDLTGNTHNIRKLDSFAFDRIDYIKIDVEDAEFMVLQGAIETILTHKPIISIEQKEHGFYGNSRFAAKEFLESIGMEQLGVVSADYILGWV